MDESRSSRLQSQRDNSIGEIAMGSNIPPLSEAACGYGLFETSSLYGSGQKETALAVPTQTMYVAVIKDCFVFAHVYMR